MKLLRRWLQREDANVSMIFGLLAIPLAGCVGALIDYSKAAEARTKLQAVIDGTAITLAKRAAVTSQGEMQTVGDGLVRGQLAARPDLTVDTVTVTKGATAITISASGRLPARMAGLFGKTTMDIASSTQVAWGARKIEVALVLDNTGSMGSSGKMDALKTATTNLIDTLAAVATEADSVKISLVPFDTGVKIGTGFANATWLSKSAIPLWQQPSWNGCVMDRDQPYDVDDTAPNGGVLSTLYPARMCPNAALAEMMGLTNDFAALKARVQAMQPSGNTNVTIGVQWGLTTLSPDEPMTGAAAFGTADVEKFMIVLTDGDNTQNRWTTSGWSIDQRTALACAAVKAKNVKVYTVRVINGDATLLQGCASSPTMYYDVQNAAQLTPVFNQIAASIRAIRLTQ